MQFNVKFLTVGFVFNLHCMETHISSNQEGLPDYWKPALVILVKKDVRHLQMSKAFQDIHLFGNNTYFDNLKESIFTTRTFSPRCLVRVCMRKLNHSFNFQNRVCPELFADHSTCNPSLPLIVIYRINSINQCFIVICE